MTGAHQYRRVLRSLLLGLALLLAGSARAQQTNTSAASIFTNISAVPAASLATASRPQFSNAYTRPGADNSQHGESASSDDALALELQTNRLGSVTQYAFTAAPGFYTHSGSNVAGSSEWSSSLATNLTAYINSSGTTAARAQAAFDYVGERRDPGALGNPTAQQLTFQAELVHALPSRFGPLEVATGFYGEQITSYASIPNQLTNPPFQYAAHFSGASTTLSLPANNLLFSIHYGKQTLGSGYSKVRAVILGVSWSW